MLWAMNTIGRLVALGVYTILLGGCAKPTPVAGDDAPTPTLSIAPGRYAEAFDQARDALRDMGFILDRVDAQLGVVTTQPKGTGGIATPWDQEQSAIDDRLEDAVQKHLRVVRIEFAPTGSTPGDAPGVSAPDLRLEQRPIDAQVSVSVYRLHQPGRRLNTQAVLYSTYTHDPQLDERGMSLYSVAVRQDRALAERIVRDVHARLERSAAGR
jgi:hypothetical protein